MTRKEVYAKYNNSEKGKATKQRYQQSPTRKAYQASGKWKLNQQKFRQSEKGQQTLREYGWHKLGINMTYSRYLLLEESCDGNCILCTSTENAARKETGMRLVVDHCHSTGEIRGLLCRKHNLSLGHFDSIISQLLQYLSKERT